MEKIIKTKISFKKNKMKFIFKLKIKIKSVTSLINLTFIQIFVLL